MAPAMRLGTRGSVLALAQAELVADAIGDTEVVPVKTEDGAHGDKERFVRGLDQALLDGSVNLTVHSAKDLPGQRPHELRIAGVPPREDPLDAFVGGSFDLDDVPEGARIGTSSLRRRSQLLALRPDLQIEDLHGNVDTRLRRLADGDYDGIVLAAAGLERLGRADEIAFRFPIEQITPAPGQGALAIEARVGDPASAAQAVRITDEVAALELVAERAAVALLEASCNTPIGVHARVEGERLGITGYCGLPDGSEWIRDEADGDPEDPAALGRALAERMIAAGAADLLKRAEEMTGSAPAGGDGEPG
jgi:hydroxymethylbilane synthase